MRSIDLRKTAAEYEDIIILVRADGSIVKLGEIALQRIQYKVQQFYLNTKAASC